MQFADFSPPSSPSLDQQRDALQKGLGRALQWAETGRLDDGPLLEACLRDMRYDVQCERSRQGWLWRMIEILDAVDRFRVPILHALYSLSDDRSAEQLCELARYYAEAGDDTFRARLYEVVEQKPIADRLWLGEEEIIQLDGEQAFLFAARVRGKSLPDREWDWDDDVLFAQAIEQFGEEPVNGLLDQTTDRTVASFRDEWRRQLKAEAERKEDTSYGDRMQATKASDIIAAAESNGEVIGFYRLRGWGRRADKAELEAVLRHLWEAREPSVVANLLKVFSARALPRFDDRLIELCRHGDDEVRRLAIQALEENEHLAIRDFALAELQIELRGKSVVGLFARNYWQGDEQRILESIKLPDDDWDLHTLLMDVLDVLEANPDADCSQLGLVVYASTPCENCRLRAARLLHGRDAAPAWLIEECRADCCEETREFAAEIAGPPQADIEQES
jgi:hypothetical protein